MVVVVVGGGIIIICPVVGRLEYSGRAGDGAIAVQYICAVVVGSPTPMMVLLFLLMLVSPNSLIILMPALEVLKDIPKLWWL